MNGRSQARGPLHGSQGRSPHVSSVVEHTAHGSQVIDDHPLDLSPLFRLSPHLIQNLRHPTLPSPAFLICGVAGEGGTIAQCHGNS